MCVVYVIGATKLKKTFFLVQPELGKQSLIMATASAATSKRTITPPTATSTAKASSGNSSNRSIINPNSSNLVLVTLSTFLGGFFVFYGLLKVSPAVSAEMHRELRRSFVKLSKVVPLLPALLGLLGGGRLSPRHLRLGVGYSEIFWGAALALGPGRLKMVANLILLILSLNATYCNCLVDEAFDRKQTIIF